MRRLHAKQIGQQIKKQREHFRLTQREVSEALGYRGGQSVYNMEQGLWLIPADKVLRFCILLDIPAEKLTAQIAELYADEFRAKVKQFAPNRDQTRKLLAVRKLGESRERAPEPERQPRNRPLTKTRAKALRKNHRRAH